MYLVIDCYIVLVSTKDLHSLSPKVRKRDVVSSRCSTKHLEEIRDIGDKVTAIFVIVALSVCWYCKEKLDDHHFLELKIHFKTDETGNKESHLNVF